MVSNTRTQTNLVEPSLPSPHRFLRSLDLLCPTSSPICTSQFWSNLPTPRRLFVAEDASAPEAALVIKANLVNQERPLSPNAWVKQL
ncbi:hypothetical protein L484_010483 [Morus notabilis]|uniref:Uncharacterized protein n=1 Tax=Morus notabilis TaxID=981085 RepID=W9QZV3_9ROSA|nr:hypothetical protein L484_010483 [Morus notabilis]